MLRLDCVDTAAFGVELAYNFEKIFGRCHEISAYRHRVFLKILAVLVNQEARGLAGDGDASESNIRANQLPSYGIFLFPGCLS